MSSIYREQRLRRFLRPPLGRPLTKQERGVLALLDGITRYTDCCADAYADPCAAEEFGIADLFQVARGMLTYAPDTLERGEIDAAYAELMRKWNLNPDTGEWEGDDD